MRLTCPDCGSVFLTDTPVIGARNYCPACSLEHAAKPKPKPAKKRKASKPRKKD